MPRKITGEARTPERGPTRSPMIFSEQPCSPKLILTEHPAFTKLILEKELVTGRLIPSFSKIDLEGHAAHVSYRAAPVISIQLVHGLRPTRVPRLRTVTIAGTHARVLRTHTAVIIQH